MKHTIRALTLASAVLSAPFASAVLLEGNTIVEEACGDVSRSMEVCLAKTADQKDSFLVVKQFGKEAVYVPVTKPEVDPRAPRRIGASEEIYRGAAAVLPARNSNARVLRKEFVFKFTKTTTRVQQLKGHLTIDGIEVGPQFRMEPQAHIMAVDSF